jgi:hypothetical protein
MAELTDDDFPALQGQVDNNYHSLDFLPLDGLGQPQPLDNPILHAVGSRPSVIHLRHPNKEIRREAYFNHLGSTKHWLIKRESGMAFKSNLLGLTTVHSCSRSTLGGREEHKIFTMEKDKVFGAMNSWALSISLNMPSLDFHREFCNDA